MKTIRKHFKFIALLLTTLLLTQSCKVYTYKPSTLDEAVKRGFERKIKVTTNSNTVYRFDRIEDLNGSYYGIAKKESSTAKKLAHQVTFTDDFDYVRIVLDKEQFSKVHVKKLNKELSVLVSVVVPAVVIGGLIALIAANLSFDWSGADIQWPDMY